MLLVLESTKSPKNIILWHFKSSEIGDTCNTWYYKDLLNTHIKDLEWLRN